ncbi:MAG: YegS/Rv2252/BmrU family lipid kinase [Clostridia bacterium]|nr:YegS/Rv2252/BmrU family lipid kinase [Clostridia bacterium]MDD4386569.1 YegS/Rv2252/BmrU family lipid kinase [Clostridia bacterium]
MKKIKLIYNSVAGQSKFKYFLDTVIGKFMHAGFEVSIFRAGKKTNLYDYLKDIDIDTYGIVVAGGDGTINRVLNVMMKNNIKIPLGIIPAGTSNDFARHIKMPINFSKCIDKILLGNIQEVDVGLANDKYFINVCSAGIFTNASQKVDVVLKNLIGKISYFIEGAHQMLKFKPFYVKIETENDIIIEKVSLFLIFNGSSVGGMDKFTDSPSIQDGLFDIIIIKDCKFHEASMLLGKILTGNHFSDKNVIYLKERWLKVTKVKGNCDDPDVDGDEGPRFPLEVTCIKNGIKMFL